MKTVFMCTDYREFLEASLADLGRGGKAQLAKAADCQPAYLSQVFAGQTDLSPEQAEKIASFLGLADNAKTYFVLLVTHERAGTPSLKKLYKAELDRLHDNQLVMKNRIRPQKVLTVEEQATFYSSWHYGVIHVSVSIPGCESERGLADYFDLPISRVNDVVEFLIQTGLVARNEQGALVIGSSTVFVGSDSPLVSKHHTNWRMRAIESLDHPRQEDLHFSGIMTCSYADRLRIREVIVKAIEDMNKIIAPSENEGSFSYGFDLFEVGN